MIVTRFITCRAPRSLVRRYVYIPGYSAPSRDAKNSSEDLLHDMNNYILSNQPEEAEKLFSVIISRQNPPVEAFNQIIRGYGMTGKIEKAKIVFNEMNRKFAVEPDVNTHFEFIKMLCLHNMVDEALKIYNSMSQNLKSENRFIGLLILELISVGRVTESKDLLFESLSNNVIPDKNTLKLYVSRISEIEGQEGANAVLERINLE
ncbi:pentatricopeptide repeat-containing protein [Acrasis kona]|uniref:Pentatricopeptide repeat-containing protein n=1 Tax=Acrasis kona TaxID=1008807 RepID=A0AAW2YUJ0_9EUKA